jgi:hypothetical protein
MYPPTDGCFTEILLGMDFQLQFDPSFSIPVVGVGMTVPRDPAVVPFCFSWKDEMTFNWD